MEGLVELALTLAAEFHRDVPSDNGGGEPVAIPQLVESAAVDKKGAPIGSLVAGMTWAILHPQDRKPYGKLDQDVRLAARIFEACDEFDDVVECAAYERTPIPQSIAEFLRDADARIDSRIAAVLREIGAPKTSLSLTGKLPVMPAAAGRLLKKSAEDTSVFDLESIAGSDPVLAGRLLSAANSAFFGFTSEVRDLKQAILRLGVPLSRKALMDAAFGPLFASSTLAELWKHSKLVAATAHELAGECGYDQEVAYVAGLLHDIGRLVMHRCPQDDKVKEVDFLVSGFPRVYAETLVYGTDHATIGGQLLKAWGLPADIVDSVANHHSPEKTDSILAAILYLAEDDATIDAMASENLSPGIRRAVAMETTGIEEMPGTRISRESEIFALTA